MAKETTAPKRDLGADYEAALKLRAFLAPLMTAPEIMEAALQAEGRVKAAEVQRQGLTESQALLERDLSLLRDKVNAAQADAERDVNAAVAATREAQDRQRQAEQQTAARIAALTTALREAEQGKDAEHARLAHERQQELAYLDGRIKALTAERQKALERLGLKDDPAE